MPGFGSYFAKQQIDEIGFHATRLQKLLVILFVITFFTTLLTGGWLWFLLYSGILFIGFFGAAKRKSCLLRTYVCIHILLFILLLLGVIFGMVAYVQFRNNICHRIEAPANETTNIFVVSTPLDFGLGLSTEIPEETYPFTPSFFTQSPFSGTAAPLRILSQSLHKPKGKHHHNDDEEGHHKHHSEHKDKGKHHEEENEHPEAQDDEDDDEDQDKYSYCWEYPLSPHCTVEWGYSSFIGKCINGKFHYEGKELPFAVILLSTFFTSLLITLKICSIILASRLARKIKCHCRGRYVQAQTEAYPTYVFPVAFEPEPVQYYPPVSSSQQIISDEELARQLQRQFDME
jgi:hypothetical protein